MPVAAGPAQPSCVVSITSGGGGAALAGPPSCVDVVPSAERYRGVPNRAQSLQMAGLSFEQSHRKMCYVTQTPFLGSSYLTALFLCTKRALLTLFERRYVALRE